MLTPTQRVIIELLRQNARETPARDDGLTPVSLARLADAGGVSTKTVGNTIRILADAGVIQRQIETGNENGKAFKRLLVAVPAILPEVTIERNHGGLRARTRACTGTREFTMGELDLMAKKEQNVEG